MSVDFEQMKAALVRLHARSGASPAALSARLSGLTQASARSTRSAVRASETSTKPQWRCCTEGCEQTFDSMAAAARHEHRRTEQILHER